MTDSGVVVAIDCDDTLWHSENRFRTAHAEFVALLADHADPTVIDQHVYETERKNLHLFGYGAKGFTLSLIETALDLTGDDLPGTVVAAIIEFGKDLLSHPIELLPGVEDAFAALQADGHRLGLITKGDLWHQESKIAASGLAEICDFVEVVNEKDPATYAGVLDRHGFSAEHFWMIGNSVRSDILPVLAIGGSAIHVPYEHVWALDIAEETTKTWHEVPTIDHAPPVIRES